MDTSKTYAKNRIVMSIDPIIEAKYRFRLAKQHLSRAERLFKLSDWVGVVQFSQLAIENFAKTLIALFEIPTWSHDPSNQLIRLINKFPQDTINNIQELANLVKEVAPEYGRSTYGEPEKGLTPNEIYDEDKARNILYKAYKAQEIVNKVLKKLNIQLEGE